MISLIPAFVILVGIIGVMYHADRMEKLSDGSVFVSDRARKMKEGLHRLFLFALVWVIGMMLLFLTHNSGG